MAAHYLKLGDERLRQKAKEGKLLDSEYYEIDLLSLTLHVPFDQTYVGYPRTKFLGVHSSDRELVTSVRASSQLV